MSAPSPQTPVSADDCLCRREVTDPRLHPSGRWITAVVAESSPEGGEWKKSTALRIWSVRDGEFDDLPIEAPAPGRGLDGGSHCWSADGTRLAVLTAGGVVVAGFDADVPALSAVTVLALDANRRWSAPALDARGERLCVVGDWGEVSVVDLDGGATTVERHGFDFAFDPQFWGDELVFQRWSRPEMPWTSSTVREGHVAAGHQHQQPRVSPDGELLGCLSDAGGVLNVTVFDRAGREVARVEDTCEHGEPNWGPGQRSWCWSPDSTKVAIARNEDGFGSLTVVALDGTDRWHIGRAVHGCLSWEGDTIAAVRSGAVTPQQLVAYDVSDLDAPVRTVLDAGDPRWSRESAIVAASVEPEPSLAPGPDGAVPYRLYRSQSVDDDERRGLIVWVHGGPTGQWQVTYMPRLVHWTSRGWDIAVIDPRGSTGHGRRHMLALHGRWGDADVDDALAVIEQLHAEGHAPGRTVLMGGSAGGLTALGAAARRPESIAAVVSSFPVVDLELLARCGDPFEGHYVPTLVGEPGLARDRRPNPARLAGIPVLMFHGDADDNVVPEHSIRLRDDVAALGGDVVLHVFPGEGHGFRRRSNQLAEFALTEEFLSSRLG